MSRFQLPPNIRGIGRRGGANVGNQTGGRVFLFLYTNDFDRDFNALRAKGIEFVREPKAESYCTVAVFKDLYGNLCDLIQPNDLWTREGVVPEWTPSWRS